MKVSQLLQRIERLPRSGELAVVVSVLRPGSIGPSPTVAIDGAHAGIDWDSGKLLLTPARTLTALSDEEVKAITAHAGAMQSYAMYEVHRAHKVEVDALKARITELERAAAAGVRT